MSDYDIGSVEWFLNTPAWGWRGVVDTILRLLEQGSISRRKAHGLLRGYLEEVGDRGQAWITRPDRPGELHRVVSHDLAAPWDELDWGA